MARARKHRQTELHGLSGDYDTAIKVDRDDQQIPQPTSSMTFPQYYEDYRLRERWWRLVRSAATSNFHTLSTSSSATPFRHSHNRHDLSSHGTSNTPHTPHAHLSGTSGQHASDAHQLDSGVTTAASTSWPHASGSATNDATLDTFLGLDTDIDFDNLIDDDFLNFDWGAWLESTKGSL